MSVRFSYCTWFKVRCPVAFAVYKYTVRTVPQHQVSAYILPHTSSDCYNPELTAKAQSSSMALRRYDCVDTTVLVTLQYHRARHEVASGVRTPIAATKTLHTLHSVAALHQSYEQHAS
eukprot:16769-Heterococcus_DN1.PRE.4